MKALAVIVLLLFSLVSISSGEEEYPPKEFRGLLRSSSFPVDQEFITIPFERTFYGIILEVKINDTPLRLLLDTGASISVLHEKKAKNLNLKILQSDSDDTPAPFSLSLTNKIEIGSAQTLKEPILVSNQLPFSSSAIDGILGLTTLIDWDFRIDCAKNELTLFPAGKAEVSANDHKIWLEIKKHPISRSEALSTNPQRLRSISLYSPVMLGPFEVLATVDTGFGGKASFPSATLRQMAPAAFENTKPVQEAGVMIDTKLKNRDVILPEFTFGPDKHYEFRASAQTAQSAFTNNKHGLLGLDLLRHYIMTFSISREKLWLKPLGTIEKSKQGGSIGMNLDFWSSDEFLVLDLEPNGPAAKAGLEKGDVLISFNEHLLKTISKETFDGLRERPPGSELKIRYRRGNNEPVDTSLILAD